MNTELNTQGPPAQRLRMIDALRGVAIVLMVVFHFCFDMAYFGLAAFDFYHDAFWLNARTFILGSFLLLVGVSLILANEKRVKFERVLKRLGIIAGAALLVSLSTWVMFGERMVFFGVLHCIAAVSVIGLLFLRAGWLNLIFGLAFIGLAVSYQSPWFDTPGRRWIGLMTHKPLTEDYVPLLPWFGVVLIGMAFGPALKRLAGVLQQTLDIRPVNMLAYAGRHSLIIYLLHQPVLLGALALYVRYLH
jgi:uncharacterized membrane protein